MVDKIDKTREFSIENNKNYPKFHLLGCFWGPKKRSEFKHDQAYPPGNYHISFQGTCSDDFPFLKVGYAW